LLGPVFPNRKEAMKISLALVLVACVTLVAATGFTKAKPSAAQAPSSCIAAIKPYVLSLGEVPRFLEFWAHFDKARKRKAIQSGVRRFEYAAERSQPEYEIVDLMIAAESLFLTETSKRDRGEMRYRLATRVALLVRTTLDERMRLWNFTRKAYDARSVIVHGGTPTEKDLLGLDGQPLRLDLFADELEQVVRKALQIATQTVAEGKPFPPNWEKLMFAGCGR